MRDDALNKCEKECGRKCVKEVCENLLEIDVTGLMYAGCVLICAARCRLECIKTQISEDRDNRLNPVEKT